MGLKLLLEDGKKIVLEARDPGDPTPPIYEPATTMRFSMSPEKAREMAVQLCEYANIVDPTGKPPAPATESRSTRF
jgi:hypothetical protein